MNNEEIEALEVFVRRGVNAQRAASREIARARTSDPDTSHDAATSMKTHALVQCELVEKFVIARGEYGATADEVDAGLGWRPTTAGRRMTNCVERKTLVKTKRKRKTRGKRDAYVYVAPLFLNEQVE